MYASNPYAPPRAPVYDVADVSISHTPAARSTRLVASILDTMIFFAMVYLPLVVAIVASGATGDVEPADTAAAIGGVLALVGFIVWCGFTLRYMQANGQSIGKKLVRIKVVRADGARASLGRLVWLRNVVNWLLSLVPLYGFVDVLFIFGESRQCLHDKLADTIVVNA